MSIVSINYNKTSDPEILSIDEIMEREFEGCVFKNEEDLYLILDYPHILQICSDKSICTYDIDNDDDYRILKDIGQKFRYVNGAKFKIEVNMP